MLELKQIPAAFLIKTKVLNQNRANISVYRRSSAVKLPRNKIGESLVKEYGDAENVAF